MGKVISIFGDRDPREVPLYSVRQVSSYLQVPSSTVRSWAVGALYPRAHKRTGRFQPILSVNAERPLLLTFNNLVEAYVLAVIRRTHDVKLKAIRRALANLSKLWNEPRPLLSAQLETDGAGLFVRELRDGKDTLLDVSSSDGNQYVLEEVISVGLKRIERSVDGLIEKIYPYRMSPDEPKVISIDPRRAFGKPVIDGTRISIAVVADLVAAGETPGAVADELGVTVDQVNCAVSWHQRATAIA